MRTLPKQQSGFSLVEMIMVIVITGIIGGMVAVFMKAPIQQYMDMTRRTDMTDVADTALRRISRDVRTAVPNSVRIAGCGAAPCVEFLPTKDGGRYRANPPGTALTFGAGSSNPYSFAIVGSAINFSAGDQIAIGSTQSDGNPPYNYPTAASGVLRAYIGAAGPQATVTFTNTALPIWAELPSQRFDVVDGNQQAVTYACVGSGTDASGNGIGQLMRYWQYGFNATQVNPPAGGLSALLAKNVSGCSIDYNPINQRFGLLAVTLTLTTGGESISLYKEIHVSNVP